MTPQLTGWVDLGRFTAGAVVDDTLYAVLYWAEEWAGLRPGAEALSRTEAGWVLAFADDPTAGIVLDAPGLPGLSPDSSSDEIEEAMRGPATKLAERIIRQRLGVVSIDRS